MSIQQRGPADQQIILGLALLLGLPLFGNGIVMAQAERFSVPLQLLPSICANSTPHTAAAKTGLSVETATDVVVGGRPVGWRATFRAGDADTFFAQRLAPGDRFRGARLEWWKSQKPELSLSVGTDCRLQAARRMVYDEHGRASAVVHLDQQLNDTSVRDLLNPPIPDAESIDGVRVALLDAGVNYMISDINQRLARDSKGHILGYDFWDLDRRPFDANPARSPFFPQRHGTRAASLLIREAPNVTLVPYRYPRPDMSRMRDVLADVRRNVIRIVGMPLGSKRMSEWDAFVESARDSKGLLFIVSAGNNGINIDTNPLYPASLDIDNMIVVTSADDSGLPAQGSNWGKESVDLLVPAENQLVTDFDGREIRASGSSYAVSRVAAMAARLVQQHPEWQAAKLKQAIFARAVQAGFNEFVSVGYLPDPLARESDVSLGHEKRIKREVEVDQETLKLSLSLIVLEESGWHESDVPALIDKVDYVLAQCNIRLKELREYKAKVSPRLVDFDAATSHTLVSQTGILKPAIFLVRDTLRNPAYEGEAFGRANSQYREWLRDTVWLTANIADPDVGMAHELFHVLSNSGAHVSQPGNLMQTKTRSGDIHLNEGQCQRARETALANGLLVR